MGLVWQLIVLGLALGFNNALASVALGAMEMKRTHQLKIALTFAVFEAVMPVIGMLFGEQLASVIGGGAKYIGIVVLLLAGLYAIFKHESNSDEDLPSGRSLSAKTLLLAVALSLDNLSVGFGLGMFRIPLGLAAVTFGIVSLLMTLMGLEIGRFVGRRVTISADKLSGVVLILTAGIMMFR